MAEAPTRRAEWSGTFSRRGTHRTRAPATGTSHTTASSGQIVAAHRHDLRTIRGGRTTRRPRRDTMRAERGVLDMTTEQLVKSKREEILRVAAQHGARNVRLFGSVARGEADEASDVDFLVEMEPGRSLLDLGGLQVEFESLLGRRVDVVTVHGLKARIRNSVLTEAVPV